MKSNKYVVVVAGGSGARMGSAVPKQFLSLSDGKVVLMHTIEAFYEADNSLHLIVVLPQDQVHTWEVLCKEHTFSIPHKVVIGGKTRFHSVKNGLELVEASVSTDDETALVAIHDGVRPFVSKDLIARSFEHANRWGSVVPTLELKDSVRFLSNEQTSTVVDRTKFRLVQTPQVFGQAVLQKAYQQAHQDTFTDDASVVEAAGYPIALIQGDEFNIKLTSPFDMILAKTILAQKLL